MIWMLGFLSQSPGPWGAVFFSSVFALYCLDWLFLFCLPGYWFFPPYSLLYCSAHLPCICLFSYRIFRVYNFHVFLPISSFSLLKFSIFLVFFNCSLKHFYHAFKSSSDNSQHICHSAVAISWLSPFFHFEIFLVLGMVNDFQLTLEHFQYCESLDIL